MGHTFRVACAFALALLATPAVAADLSTELASAREALAGGDPKAALGHLDLAQEAAAGMQQAVPAKLLSQIWHLRGAALYAQGDDDHMDAWRVALVIDNELAWDEALVTDSVAWDVFEALRREVRGRPEVDLQLPEATGAAKLFVNGERKRPGDAGVREGEHLGQIECPDGVFYGKWTDFRKKMKWLKMCPGGVDTTVVVADDAPADDEWGDFGPSFGPEPGEGGDEPVVAAVTPAEGTQEVEIVRKKVLWPAFAAGAGVLVTAGAFQAIALGQNAKYNDITNPDYQTAAELEELRKATNRNQTLVYPLLAVSGGLFFAATYQW